jgi:hypothetical protein
VVIVGMVLGGGGAALYFLTSGSAPQHPPPAPPAATDTPEGLATAVVDRLNAKDLAGVIDLTCAQGKNTGRRELIAAVPALDPTAPESVRDAPLRFTLKDVTPFSDGYVAAIQVSYQGATGDGKMRIQRGGDQSTQWTLCGLDSPRLGGTG